MSSTGNTGNTGGTGSNSGNGDGNSNSNSNSNTAGSNAGSTGATLGTAAAKRPTGDRVTDDALAHETVTNDAVAGEPVISETQMPDDASVADQSGMVDTGEDYPVNDDTVRSDLIDTNEDREGVSTGVGSKGSSSGDPGTFSNEFGEAQPSYDEHAETEIELGVDAADSRQDGHNSPLIADATQRPDVPPSATDE